MCCCFLQQHQRNLKVRLQDAVVEAEEDEEEEGVKSLPRRGKYSKV